MTKNLTKGSPMRLILSFGIPVLFGYLFQQLYNVVDTAIVGKTLGVRPWRRWAPPGPSTSWW